MLSGIWTGREPVVTHPQKHCATGRCRQKPHAPPPSWSQAEAHAGPQQVRHLASILQLRLLVPSPSWRMGHTSRAVFCDARQQPNSCVLQSAHRTRLGILAESMTVVAVPSANLGTWAGHHDEHGPHGRTHCACQVVEAASSPGCGCCGSSCAGTPVVGIHAGESHSSVLGRHSSRADRAAPTPPVPASHDRTAYEGTRWCRQGGTGRRVESCGLHTPRTRRAGGGGTVLASRCGARS